MDNPVDHIVDLGLVNYTKHPSNPNYIVYRFADEKRAASFEKVLTEKGIWFEKGEEEKRQRTYILIGVHKNDFKHTEKINFEVEAEHKKPFIPFKFFRYFILLISLLAITLAVIGYSKSRETLRLHNNELDTINEAPLSGNS